MDLEFGLFHNFIPVFLELSLKLTASEKSVLLSKYWIKSRFTAVWRLGWIAVQLPTFLEMVETVEMVEMLDTVDAVTQWMKLEADCGDAANNGPRLRLQPRTDYRNDLAATISKVRQKLPREQQRQSHWEMEKTSFLYPFPASE